jgi:hypothetical protein
MLSQETKDRVIKVYQKDPEEIQRLAKFGDVFEKAAALTILEVVGVRVE